MKANRSERAVRRASTSAVPGYRASSDSSSPASARHTEVSGVVTGRRGGLIPLAPASGDPAPGLATLVAEEQRLRRDIGRLEDGLRALQRDAQETADPRARKLANAGVRRYIAKRRQLTALRMRIEAACDAAAPRALDGCA